MYKLISIKEEKNILLNDYYANIGDERFLEFLEEVRNRTGFGLECMRILFKSDLEEWEEEYSYLQEKEVVLLAEFPAAKEDSMFKISFEDFFENIKNQTEKYL